MTEHVVLSRATAYRAELEREEHVALLSLSAVRSERARVEQFLELYARFSAVPEPEKDEAPFVLTPEGWKHAEESQSSIQESAPLGAVVSDVVTPSPDESVTSREGAEPAAPGTNSPDDDRIIEGSGNVFVDLGFTEEQGRKIVAAHGKPEDLDAQAAVEGLPVAEQMSQIRAAMEGPKKNVGGRPPNSKLRERLLAFKAENPNAAVRDAAIALGVGSGSISIAAKALGISFPHARLYNESLPDRVAGVFAEHPDWTARKIADHLGADPKSVRTAAQTRGIALARVSEEERLAIQREVAAKLRQHAAARRAQLPPKPVRLSFRDRKSELVALHAAHPEWTLSEIAEAFGASVPTASMLCTELGIVLPKKQPAKAVEAAPKATPNPDRERQPVTSLSPKPTTLEATPKAPAKAPKVEEPLAFAGDPDEEDAEYVHPSLRRYPAPKAGGKVMLRRADGQYLHGSGTGFTTNRTYAWSGTRAQLAKAREVFPDTNGLQVVQLAVKAK